MPPKKPDVLVAESVATFNDMMQEADRYARELQAAIQGMSPDEQADFLTRMSEWNEAQAGRVEGPKRRTRGSGTV